MIIFIANDLRNMGLKLSDIEIRFTRRNYENIQEKAQVLTMMLANDKIHPELAFKHCGLFTDPNLAYILSKEYEEEQTRKTEQSLQDFVQEETNKSKQQVESEDESDV